MHAYRPRAAAVVLAVITSLLLFGATRNTHEAAAQSGTQPQPPAVCTAPAAIPADYDYSQTEAAISHWVSTSNVARTRIHGWSLFAALNQTVAGEALWRTWCTSTQAFFNPANPAAGGMLGAAVGHHAASMRTVKFHSGLTTPGPNGEEPINFPNPPIYPVPASVQKNHCGCVKDGQILDGASFESNGDVMAAGVIYNKTAYDWIRSQRLYESATLNQQKPKAPAGQTAIQDFPPGSIVLKPMLWPVQRSGFTALPVWDNLTSDGGQYIGFEVQKKWSRAVAITPTPQSTTIRPASITYLYGVKQVPPTPRGSTIARAPIAIGPNTYRNFVVGVQDFYNWKPQIIGMDDCDRAILDASANYAYNRDFASGDYVVLVGMHIMTKEQTGWTFQTFWWTDKPSSNPYSADQPSLPSARGPWQHYAMTTTYGIPASPGLYPVAFNPYIELAADHPIETNCMNCHHRAAWPKTDTGYLVPGGPSALAIYSQNNPFIFNGTLKVDSLWSIADRAESAAINNTTPKAPPGLKP